MKWYIIVQDQDGQNINMSTKILRGGKTNVINNEASFFREKMFYELRICMPSTAMVTHSYYIWVEPYINSDVCEVCPW